MCMAKLYEATKGDEPILEDIAYMIVEGERVKVETLFGKGGFSRARCARWIS